MKTLKTFWVTVHKGQLRVFKQGSQFSTPISEISVLRIRASYQRVGDSIKGNMVLIGRNDAYQITPSAVAYMGAWMRDHQGSHYPNTFWPKIKGHRLAPREHGQGALYQLCVQLYAYLLGEQVRFTMASRQIAQWAEDEQATVRVLVPRPVRKVRHITDAYPVM